MMDNVLVLNEVVDFVKREKKRCMVVEMDFGKTYDYVLWDFLRRMLRSMGFGVRWCGWLEVLVFNISMYVLVNGSPTTYFKVTRGLRQGDPISLFLFLLGVEGFAGLLHQVVSLGKFEGFHFNANSHFSLL